MVLRLTSILAVLTVLPLAGQAPGKIGVVLTVAGRWCRQAMDLQVGNPIYLKDDIRYCATTVKTVDQIVIRFDGTSKPYDRTYACATPGICGSNAPLWLNGANAIRNGPPPGSTLISSPPTASLVIPDLLIGQGEAQELVAVLSRSDDRPAAKSAPGGIIAGFGLGSKSAASIGWTSKDASDTAISSRGAAGAGSAGNGTVTIGGSTVRICRLQNSQIVGCNDLKDTEDLTPGLYGIFAKEAGNTGSPTAASGLIGVVKNDSTAESKWNLIPRPYLADRSPQTIVERRAYLLELIHIANQ